jgi:uncharacterized membrane protein YcjF (UPF0283 family)
MDNIDWWVWLIIAVVIIALVAATMRVGSARRLQSHRDKAATLREEAGAATVEARHREADAATARAQAENARFEADRLEQEARQHDDEALRTHGEVQEQLAEADRVDPDLSVDPPADDAYVEDHGIGKHADLGPDESQPRQDQ